MFKKTVTVVELGNDGLKILGRSSKWFSPGSWRFFAQSQAEMTEPLPGLIGRVFRELDLPRNRVILCLPRHLVATVRILELPATDPREIQDMINLQIGKHTPYAREEVVASYKIIASELEGYTKVMLVIVRQDIIGANWRALQEAGLKVEKVVLSSEGTFRWFQLTGLQAGNRDSSSALAVVDLDAGYSDFIVVRGRRMMFAKPILMGARQAAEEPQAWIEKFIEELRHSLELYQQGSKDGELTQLVFSGARSLSPEQVERIRSALGIPVSIVEDAAASAAKWPVLQPEQSRLLSISPLLGTAICHADMDIDLTSGALRVGNTMDEKRKNITIMGVLLISIMMMSSLLLMLSLYNRNAYLTQLQEMRNRLQSESRSVANMREDIELIRRRLDPEGSTLNLLQEIYSLTPREIFFIDIQVAEKRNVILKGEAQAMSHVFRFVTTLEDSPLFENVQATRTTSKKKGKVECYEFEIVCAYSGK